jgi:uncharacterized lipoprotein YbaY/heat shock protein HslJ/uncharacterized lipoprotein NlpE involved in copper resistance
MHKPIVISTRTLMLICLVLSACVSQGPINVKKISQEAQVTPADSFVTVSGSVAYMQRIAMPPDALLTIRVEDVSRADVSAPVLAEMSEPFGARQVPIKFSLKVPSVAIDPRMAYAVRATITVNGKLRFTTTRNYAVLSRGAANNVDLVLDAAQKKDSTTAPPPSIVSFALPATFSGVVPCADCAGIDQTLTLRADGLYRLRSTYVGKPDGTFTELGRWEADASGKQITLRSGKQTRMFSVTDNATLRLLDQLGQPIKSTTNLDLRRTAQVDPISEQLRWRGEFIYLADSATFTDCASGLRWPVAMVSDYLAVERTYQQLRNAPAAPLLVSFDGRLEVLPAMEGPPREQMVVDRFDSSHPETACDAVAPDKAKVMAELKNTYWKLIELDGKKVTMAPTQAREVRITLASEDSRLIAFGGCNQLAGSYVLEGNKLKFTQMISTLMVCVSPFMELDGNVLKTLDATNNYRIDGEQLTLLGGDQVLARFEAVYLK